ncbi:hypothetical protein [Methylobacterium oryzihabitans]|uniref:Uncharacterized protein n=1 Tax=Methylobacterium oryzihabitans TaxID=2499852 RepID=A0A3S2VV70_9HYPH|nr:hypothetical protein [Methylobacterium oryzihabitans]RVU18352.1 hypothetical protein EOE48_10660 [Methylobacterium oryzihabitans]
MSNRDVQPLKFSCNKCGTVIEIHVTAKGANTLDDRAIAAIALGKKSQELYLNQGVKWTVTNASEVALEGMFDPTLDFVDLHLDFPVVFGTYVPGNTPYMQAVGRSGNRLAVFHRERLGIINEQYKKYPEVTELISKYIKGFYGPFSDYAKKRFKITVKSKKMEDINATLYKVVNHYVLPFTLPHDNREIVQKYTATVIDLMQNKTGAMAAFLQELYDTNFLANLQRDCLKVYKPIFDAELPLRPALFLDVDKTYAAAKTAMRVSSQDFIEYREVYKDMAEVLNRQLVLVAGMGNLIERGDHNAFAVRTSKNGRRLSPASLNDYSDVALGSKLQDLDSGWYIVDPLAHDNELRNAIAHNKIDYDDATQIITYYPKLEGMEREKKQEIQLLDYMHRLLVLFREVHRIHHLVKCLNYALLIEPGASMVKR